MSKTKGASHRTNERDKALYDAYCEKLKQLGEMAKYYPKMVLYEDVGDLFFLSGKCVSRRIKAYIKNGIPH